MHQGPDGPAAEQSEIEHLVTHQDDGGQMVVIGLDADCKPVYTTAFFDYA
jgi:hypothetical protein